MLVVRKDERTFGERLQVDLEETEEVDKLKCLGVIVRRGGE